MCYFCADDLLYTVEEAETANQRFRSLVVLHIRTTLLSDVFATAGQAQGRAAIGLLQTLMNNTSPQVLSDLGTLHRASIWENIALAIGLSSKGIDIEPNTGSPPLGGSPNQTTSDLPAADITTSANGRGIANGVQSRDGVVPPNGPSSGPVKQDTPRNWNASSLKHLTQGLPNALAPFFQGNTNHMIERNLV
jgi:E3 ubiquitin-protein ligase HUWE1